MKDTFNLPHEDAQRASVGLLVLRIGIGLTFLMVHGWPKLTGGPETWAHLGGAMGLLGITFKPVFWGFIAAVSEALGGLFLIIGFVVRPAALLLMITMGVALLLHASKGESFMHPLELGIVFLALFVSGGGPYSLDHLLKKKLRKKSKRTDVAGDNDNA